MVETALEVEQPQPEDDEDNNSDEEDLDPLLTELDRYDLLCGQLLRIVHRDCNCIVSIACAAVGVEALLELIFMLCTQGFSRYSGYSMGYGTHIQLEHYYSIDRTYQTKQIHFYSNLTNHNAGTKVFWLILINSIIVYGVACLAKGALVVTVAQLYAAPAVRQLEQEEPTTNAMKDSYKNAARKAVPLVAACLLVSIFQEAWSCLVGIVGLPLYHNGNSTYLVYLGFAFLVGILLFLFTHLMVPAVMVESKSVGVSVQRSFQLLSVGSLWKTFQVFFVYQALQALIVDMFLGWIQLTVFGQATAGAFLIGMILTYFIHALFLAIHTIVATVVYFHLRCKREQLEPDTLAAEIGLMAISNQHGCYTNMDHEHNGENKKIAVKPDATDDAVKPEETNVVKEEMEKELV